MKGFLSLVTILAALTGAPVSAQNFNDGLTAFQGGDYETAIKNWMPLAEKDDAEAQRNVGIMFQQGLGVPQSDVEAAHWYRRAAENGHARAQQNLGVMFEEGAGVPQDFVEAAKWYRLSAQQGNVVAKLNLGVMLEQDLPGLPQDLVQTHMWYNIAASQGSVDAAKFRDDVAQNMTRQQIADAQRMAQEWLAKYPQ